MRVNLKVIGDPVDGEFLKLGVTGAVGDARGYARAYTKAPELVAKRPRDKDRFSVSVPDDAFVVGELIPGTESLHSATLREKSIDWSSLATYLPGTEQ